MTDRKDGVATAAMLLRASEVLQSCAASVTQLEELLGLFDDSAFDSSNRLVLQKFDHLGQCLVDLSLCLDALADAHRSDATIDPLAILAPLRLHDLRLYLAGQALEHQASPGQVALF